MFVAGILEIAIQLITALHPSIAKLDAVKAPWYEPPLQTIEKDGSFATNRHFFGRALNNGLGNSVALKSFDPVVANEDKKFLKKILKYFILAATSYKKKKKVKYT